MTHICCFCGKPIHDTLYTLTVTKDGCGAGQVLFCHEACLEAAMVNPKDLYLKCL